MTSTSMTNGAASEAPGTAVAMRFEVTVLPVADVDRAKGFYERIGWRLDADFPIDEHFRIVQFTPPGSPASIQFGTGLTTLAPGTMKDMYLVVEDIDAARAELAGHGVDVSEVWHGRGPGNEGHQPGIDPARKSYGSFASFADPDGNTWLLQEITERLPGRVDMDIPARARLLAETGERHGRFEAVTPPHDWWDWYAAYMDARERGQAPDDAAEAAGRYMADVKHIVPTRATP
jgi:catechol 2,3-dioxygenase-like lactoylglutathione lyase family enzyme